MSNQVYRNSQKRYDLANVNMAIYQLSANESVADAVTHKVVNWESVTTDHEDVTLSSGTFTIQRLGAYVFSVGAVFVTNAVGYRWMDTLYTPVGAASFSLVNSSMVAVTGKQSNMNSAITLEMEKGDTIQFRVEQNSGAPLDLDAGVDPATRVTICRIA